ncbi:hypothetical protein DNTS_003337 [Danionella cerebrum]|uniref:Ig-like domain-containing protein n=1 Tax=Danionella cerebrum TaxID=2873325 RepID=A0A553QPQ4_9TELE|nr:hypothetical protein DNTS_003337 [Danionella translucida]
MREKAAPWRMGRLLFLAGFLLSDLCHGQRDVQIQEGPLYRVEGFPISILCSVSGFTGQAEQDFEFGVRKSFELNMISTKDPHFPYAVFSSRVRAKEIEIERLSGSSALLRIKRLEKKDEGEIFCHTPNTDARLWGNYSAETTLHVIKDTLKASYSGPPSQSLSEADALQLECEVSSETFQHTHLSVSWLVRAQEDQEPRAVITLDKDLTVKPGEGFEARYHAGFISMDKVEDTTFRLKISQVQQSDQGKFFCRAMEWIQDPDRTWTQISHKTTAGCQMEIRTMVAPDVDSFSVSLKASVVLLQQGGALDLHCRVNAQNLQKHFFSVTWMKNEKPLAQIGSSGMLTVFDGYKEREKAAEVRSVKASNTDYLLSIRSARTEDQGQYRCEVWQETMDEDGSFKRLQKQLSNPETVNVTVKESDLRVEMFLKDPVTEGDTLRVTCAVSGFRGALSVSWKHKRESTDAFSDVISQTHEGVMKDPGTRYQSRRVQTLHSPGGNLSLEISESAPSDSGEYRCIVSEWTLQSNGEMKDAHSQSQQGAVAVQSIESLLKVRLKSRKAIAPIDSPVELLCTAGGPSVPLDVRWMFQPPGSAKPQHILSIENTGEISWASDQRNYQLSIQTLSSSTVFSLLMPRVSKQQEGQYHCVVNAYQKGIQKAMRISNSLAVAVQSPVSKLSLSALQPHLEATVNTEATVECSVLRTTTNSSRFTVTWMRGSEMLVTMDLDGVVSSDPAADLEKDQRIRMDARKKQTFTLTLQQVRPSDSGQYICQVEEWLQDPLGEWYSLEKMNASTELMVKEEADNLHVQKQDQTLNISDPQGGFTTSCTIDSRSSDRSVFEVTWFRVQEEEAPVAIFTASRDGTLHTREEHLVPGRPRSTLYTLSIPRTSPSDTGKYYCQVEEWILRGTAWNRLASDQSGVLSVHVHSDGGSGGLVNPLGIALALTVPLICVLLLLISFLLRREHQRLSEEKKKKKSLWAENLPLTPSRPRDEARGAPPPPLSYSTEFFQIPEKAKDAESSVVYVETRTNLTLCPRVEGSPEDILWKFKGNKVAERDSNGFQDYGEFKERCSIDLSSGNLTVLNMRRNDSGVYESEIAINGRVQNSNQEVKVIDAVQELLVSCKVDPDSHSKTLRCSEIQPPSQKHTFEWTGSSPASPEGPELRVEPDTQPDAVFTCTVRNEVSKKNISFRIGDCSTEEGMGYLAKIGIAAVAVAVVVGVLLMIFISYCSLRKRSGRPRGLLEVPLNDLRGPHGASEGSVPDQKPDQGLVFKSRLRLDVFLTFLKCSQLFEIFKYLKRPPGPPTGLLQNHLLSLVPSGEGMDDEQQPLKDSEKAEEEEPEDGDSTEEQEECSRMDEDHGHEREEDRMQPPPDTTAEQPEREEEEEEGNGEQENPGDDQGTQELEESSGPADVSPEAETVDGVGDDQNFSGGADDCGE